MQHRESSPSLLAFSRHALANLSVHIHHREAASVMAFTQLHRNIILFSFIFNGLRFTLKPAAKLARPMQ
jgi:hypothetical protein